MTNPWHEANRGYWDASSENWARCADSRELWRRCPKEPELVLCDRELARLRDVRGRRICVLGSGDNEAVFALAGLGASVTSVDISGCQLEFGESVGEWEGAPMRGLPESLLLVAEKS